jgi:hypothetical protein
MSNALTIPEKQKLQSLEITIQRGLKIYIEVGTALLAIRDERLYRAEFGTFEEYCEKRLNMSRIHAHRLIQASEVAEDLLPIGNTLPANEAQARELAALPREDRAAAWQTVVETAPASGITASFVRETVETFVTESRPMKPKVNQAGDIYEPKGYDACQTPPEAINPLLPYLSEDWTIWECAKGEGGIVEALYDSGFQSLTASDILTGENFFEYEPSQWDCIVTNPPYSIKYQWLERCYALGKPFALLLPVETLGAKTAQEFFRKCGLEVIFMDRRINFKMPNKGWEGSSAQFPTAWFTYGLNIGQQITFARLDDGI